MRCEIFTTKKELIRTKGNFREVIMLDPDPDPDVLWCEHPAWRPLNILWKMLTKFKFQITLFTRKQIPRKLKIARRGVSFLTFLRSLFKVFLLPLSIHYQPERRREEGKYTNKGILHDLTLNFKFQTQKKCTEDNVENCYWDHIGTKRF